MTTLTTADVMGMAAVIEAASKNAKVARAADDGSVQYGTARAITNDQYMMHLGDDIRDAYLWVTTRSGMETLWPIRGLMAEYRDGLFAEYDWH